MLKLLALLLLVSVVCGVPQGRLRVPETGRSTPSKNSPSDFLKSSVGLSNNEEKVCLTPGCVKAAATVLDMIDTEQDPCNDFYDFACGNFIKESVIADHETTKGAFTLVRDKLYERLRKLFESKSKPNEPAVFESVRKYYKSCMDQASIEDTSRKTMLELVDKLGGWPTLQGDKWKEDKFTWHAVDEAANIIGLDSGNILSFGISTNPDNSTMRMMEVDQPSLGLEREYLIKGFEDGDVQAYYKYMVDIAVYLGAEKSRAETELKESLLFELKLAEMSLPREERRNATALNNQMTLEEGNKMYPAFNWTDHVRNILDNPEVPINSSEVINVAVPVYVQKLAAYMPSVPARVQANYLLWRFIKGMVSFSDKEARQIQLKYNMVLTGKEQESPRWETCVKTTSGNGENYLYFYEGSLTNAVGAMYAKEYFPESSKQIADDMVSNIKKEFKTMLDELDWMDDITRKKAHSKVDKMKPFIGYAKEILDDKLINEYYKGLDLNSPSYLKNFLKLKTFINEYYVKVFRDPIDNHSWKTHGGAAIVNAFYSPNENSIQFPAGILDGVFFKDDRPSYMNYGAIGVVVGHEITHGFDDTGSQKDGDGNLVDWWEPQTKKKYLERAQCIIDQYSNFTVDVVGEILNVNGINTQGENIADNGGYKEAYRAYEKLTKEQGEELSLPGLPYTPRQLFWISGASIWCNIWREEALKNRVLTDPHAPGRYRVNGSYRNQKEFSKDWNCPKGSNMNPEKKCSVW